MHSHLNEHPALICAIRHLEKLNIKQFEIYHEHHSATQIDSKDQKVDHLSRTEDVGMAIRLIKNKKLGFSFTTSLENPAIKQAIHTALEITEIMPEDEYLNFYSFNTSEYPNIDHWDTQGLKTPLQEKIVLTQFLEESCRKSDPRITAVRRASLSESCLETHLVDSTGQHIHHRSTTYTASLTCKAESHGDSQIGSDFSFSHDLNSLEIEKVAKQSAQLALELLGAQLSPTLRCPAVLRNSVVADLLEFLSDSFSAENIEKGRSMLAGKLGESLFSDQVTVINDGLLTGGLGTSPFDGEGIPCKKIILIERGVPIQTLLDSYYAKKTGKDPTGSSIRGIKTPPTIGVSNLYLKEGQSSPESLIQKITHGILITDLMGLHTANPVTGQFSLGASGILIEKGRLTRPVRGFAVAGNVLDLFRRITDISHDLRFFGRVGAPSILLNEISVSGM